MKSKNKKILEQVKSSRKLSREEEIKLHGKQLIYSKIQKSKKIYNRKKVKADRNDLPYFYKQI